MYTYNFIARERERERERVAPAYPEGQGKAGKVIELGTPPVPLLK